MANPIRIGIIGWSAQRISGTGSVLRTLLQGLKNNFKVNFIIALPPLDQSPYSNFSDFPMTLSETDLETIEVKGETLHAWMQSALQVLAPRVDVIFYPDSVVLPPSPDNPKKIVGVTLLHDVLPLTLPEYKFHPLKYWAEKKKFLSVVRHADRIITISEYSRRMIVEKLKVPDEKIQLIPNGIDPAFHNPEFPQVPSRRGVLYVGDLRRRKNVMALVKAYLLLNQDIRREHPLIIVADGKQREAILKLFKAPQQPPIFLADLSPDNLKKVYLRAKAFVFPSIQEGFGLPVIEAQHNGLPVICGDHTSLGEITRNNPAAHSTAYYVDITRPEAIADAITDLISHPAVYQGYQMKGFTNSCRFTSARMVADYQSFFEEIN